MATANEAGIDMKCKPTSFVIECGNHARQLAPVTALLFLTGGFAWSPGNQEGPSFDEETAHIAQALDLEPGLTVADVGAGKGRYTVFLAEAVTSTGTVYATEVDEGLLTDIRQAIAWRTNVTVILGKQDSTELPDQCCDRILLRRVYHHFEEPHAMLASLRASLKPGGVIAVVDFLHKSSEFGRPDATPHDHEHGVRIDGLTEQMEKAGFELVRQVEDWPSRVRHGRETDFCVVFRRPG
jgi:SAM-dependent methyltransferase